MTGRPAGEASGCPSPAVNDDYGHLIGTLVDDLLTPVLVVDRPAFQRNIALRSASLAGVGITPRPHTKAQKPLGLAALQVAAGVGDVLIANAVVGASKIRAVAATRWASVTCCRGSAATTTGPEGWPRS